MIGEPQRFFSPDGDGGGESGAEPPEWHGDSEYLRGDPEAAKAFTKYQTPDDQLKAHREAMKLLGQPYRLPNDYSKLTDDQKADIEQWRAKARGVPESPDSYEIDVPENFQVFDEIMAEFKQFCHRTGKTPDEAKELFGLHVKTFEFANKARDKVIQGMADQNYKTFLNDDCGGDAQLAAARMENVKRLLQSQCVDKDGNPDSVMWEKFAAQLYHHDRMIQLPLMRALSLAAQMTVGTGGAPGGALAGAAAPGAFDYAEMDGKKK